MLPENSERDGTEPTSNVRNAVYYAGQTRYERGEVDIAGTVADALGIPVVVTAGPYRGHSVHYELYANPIHVHMDFHAPAPTRGYDVEEVVADIRHDLAGVAGPEIGP